MTASALIPLVSDRLWRFQRPVWYAGIRQRAYTTIVRLDDGALLMHSPAPLSPAAAAELGALGPVRWLVVPNRFHHLGAPAAAAQFPGAQVIGPGSALARNRDLRLDLALDDTRVAAQLPEFELRPLSGVPFLDETVLFHRPTRTLLAADLFVCAGPTDHWTTRVAARLFGFFRQVRVPPDVAKRLPDRAATAGALRAILALPADRVLVGHADPLEEGWRDQVTAAWRRAGVEV